MEYWDKITSKSENYAISTFGRVWSARYGLISTPLTKQSYPHCNIMVNGITVRVMVHHTMGDVFIPNPHNKKTINHKDGIRWNNHIDNLEWATSKEQNQHSVLVLGRKGAKNLHRRKAVLAYREGLQIIVEENGIREMGRRLDIPYQAIQTGIKNNNRTYFGWKFELMYDPKWKPKLK